jgi:hypothetical protein
MLQAYRRTDTDPHGVIRRTLEEINKMMPCDADKYYAIARGGSTRNCWIGKTLGEGIPDVLTEEPGVRFVRISEKEFDREDD